jgi:hypothetical protein
MAKFYDGQPIVCVWDAEQWGPIYPGSTIPRKGGRFTAGPTISEEELRLIYCNPTPGARVCIREYGTCWNERGFEPVTENRVRALEAISTDMPDEVYYSIEEDA